MTTKIFIDRSRIITRERCPRRRFLEYHESGTGIVPKRTPLALGVGSAVHSGLASLLMNASDMDNQSGLYAIEEDAVRAALADFSAHASGLELDANESAALGVVQADAKQLAEQMITQARELGMSESDIAGITQGVDPAVASSEFERYLFAEQSALVEALVRAYARRRLRPLLEEFEVLEVEREGAWKLSEFDCFTCDGNSSIPDMNAGGAAFGNPITCPACGGTGKAELWFMSRPDALLRHRQSNELYLLSYKTTGGWDVRKARDIEHDMQGLSEGVEVERRLGGWWELIKNRPVGALDAVAGADCSEAMFRFLRDLPAPPRIHAIRYEFLLKGERWKDRELSARLGIECRSQQSHLIRQYVATSTPKKGDGGYSVGDVCWSWDFYRPEDDKDSKLAWQNWKSRAIFGTQTAQVHGLDMDVKNWIDKLDSSELLMSGEDSTVGLVPRQLGWKSAAQAMGVTKEHPLDKVFTVQGADGRPTQAITVWRSDDQLRDWVEQVEHAEREVAMHVAEVNAATDPGEKRSLLNRYFPQVRQSCEYPGTCPYARDRVSVCWGSAEMQADPLAVGGREYVRRVANHPQELVNIK